MTQPLVHLHMLGKNGGNEAVDRNKRLNSITQDRVKAQFLFIKAFHRTGGFQSKFHFKADTFP